MSEFLREMLAGTIDYAGLFPPAELSMKEAVGNYVKYAQDEKVDWIMHRFICPATRLGDLIEELEQLGFKEGYFPVTVIGTATKDHRDERLIVERDLELIEAAVEKEMIDPQVYEFRTHFKERGAIAALGRYNPRRIQKQNMHIYCEIPWKRDIGSLMDHVIQFPEIGVKARMGGAKPEEFANHKHTALFIGEACDRDLTMKFTAGLHSPLRYYDRSDRAWHQGFFNVLAATALRLEDDLSRRQIDEVLEIKKPDEIRIKKDCIEILDYKIEERHLARLEAMCGGFGSCSVEEPLAALKKLKWIK